MNFMPRLPPSPPSGTRMAMLFCSSVPSISAAPLAIWRTGRIMRAACEEEVRDGWVWEGVGGGGTEAP